LRQLVNYTFTRLIWGNEGEKRGAELDAMRDSQGEVHKERKNSRASLFSSMSSSTDSEESVQESLMESFFHTFAHAKDLNVIFEVFILCVILTNVVVLLVSEPGELSDGITTNGWDIAFLAVFTMEALCKIGGHGFYQYVTLGQHMNKLQHLHKQMEEEHAAAIDPDVETAAKAKLQGIQTQIACMDYIIQEKRKEKLPPSDDYITREPYIRSRWNQLDLFILCCLWLVFVAAFFSNALVDLNHLTLLRTLRAARVLAVVKTLRLFSMSRDLVEPLYQIWPHMWPSIFLLVGATFTFGLIGVSLFRDKLVACNEVAYTTKSTCIGLFLNPSTLVYTPRVWSNPAFSFDTIVDSMFTLFQVVSMETWVDIMYETMDRTEWSACLYFVVFVTVASIFIMQLFQGVVIQRFNEARSEALFTWKQTIWNTTKEYIKEEALDHHTDINTHQDEESTLSWVSKTCQNVRKSFFYQVGFTAIVFVHVGFICTKHYGEPASWTETIKIIDWVGISFYLVDVALALGAVGHMKWKDFFADWNQATSDI